MTIRPHFGVTESNGIAEIGLVDNQAQVRNSLFLLKNAQKIHYSEEVIKAYDALKNSKEHEVRDLKELVAADLKSRSEKQISIVTKFFDFIGSLFFSSFGYETTMDKIKTAFSVIIRKDYEGDQKEEEISKSPKSADRSKVKEEDKPKSKDKDAERQDNPKADDEANQLLKKQAQEQADKESQERLAKEESERNAKEKADKESQERQAKERTEREKAEKEAALKAEMDARSKIKTPAGKKRLPPQEEAERLDDLNDYKESLRSMEDYKKDLKNIELQQALQALHRSNEMKAAMNKEIHEEVEKLYTKDFDKIIDLFNSNNVQEVFNIIRAYPQHLQDPFLEYAATTFSANYYYLGRLFALSIADEKKRNEILASRGLLNEFESFELSQKSEEGKKIAEFIQSQKYEEALKSINDPTYLYWILSAFITNSITNDRFDEAQKLINLLQKKDLKAELQRHFNAKINLVKIYNELIKQVPHTTMVNQELMSALELLKKGEIDKAVDQALVLPANVLAHFSARLVEAYIERAQYVEARELVKLMTAVKKNLNLLFDISPEAVFEECARALIARGDLEEGLHSASLLSEQDQLKLIDRDLERYPTAAYIILSRIRSNQDDRLLKVIRFSADESIARKALSRMQNPVLTNFGRLAIAAIFGSLPDFLECTNEALMIKSLDQFMNSFNIKRPVMDVKDIEALEAKVDALSDKELKKVLYGAVRSLYNRLPPNLEIGSRLTKKVKGLS